MKQWFILSVVVIFATGAGSGLVRTNRSGQDPNEEISIVSPITLIANAEDFHDKAVIVQGVVGGNPVEGWDLFLGAEFEAHGIISTAVWLEATPAIKAQLAAANRKWANIRGRFDKNLRGHLGGVKGGIKEIDRIVVPK